MPAASFNGVCYPTVFDATNAFLQQYPRIDNSSAVPKMQEIGSFFQTPIGVYYVMISRDVSTNALTVYPGTSLIVPPCNYVPFDPLLAASFWSFAIVFVVSAWLLAKNAGLIIAAVRRY